MAARSARFWRAAATIALLLYMAAALASGMDQIGERDAAWARWLPATLRGRAQRTLAAEALLQGDAATALEAAWRAIRAEPVEPASTALFGAAQALSGNAAGADAAFRVAAMFGWRVPITQFYWYDASLRAALPGGDPAQAALRADALLRAAPMRAEGAMLIAGLEASASGREALAARLAHRPNWTARYFLADRRSDTATLAHKSAVALKVAAAGARIDCQALTPLVRELRERGMHGDARAAWRAHCGDPGEAGGIADGGFAQLAAADADANPPFGWRLLRWADVQVDVVSAGRGAVQVQAHNHADIARAFLVQQVDWPPGNYRVRFLGPDPAALRNVFASFDCGGPAQQGPVLRAAPCARAALKLWLKPGAGTVAIGGVTAQRVD